MKFLQTLTLMLIISFVAGSCVPAIPWPSFTQLTPQGKKIYNLLGKIKIGSTTKQEVTSLLGLPMDSWGGTIWYDHVPYDKGMKIYVLSPIRSVKVKAIPETYLDLQFEFDNDGVLKGYNTFKYKWDNKYVRAPFSWSASKACRFDCIQGDRACFNSISEEPTQAIRICKSKKEQCFQKCKSNEMNNGMDIDCDPGLDSCD